MKRFLFVLVLLNALHSSAQLKITEEIKFIEHLVSIENYNDAIFYINKNPQFKQKIQHRDSINYLKGWSHYALKELDLSAASLLEVSKDSPFFLKSRFFAAYNYSHLKLHPVSENILSNIDNHTIADLQKFELAGNALLSRDFTQFSNYIQNIQNKNNYIFTNEILALNKISNNLAFHPKKSAFLGGLFSAIIPGSGKIYAGKTGEGIASFIIVSATGLTAYENYNKRGIKHAKTLLFGSLFAVLYIGNIYGSVFSVKITNDEFNHEMDHNILFNMHIPLRNYFN